MPAPTLPPADAPSASDWTDEELRSRMLARQDAAWREFHRRFDRLIYRCIHNVTRRFRSTVSSEDVHEIRAQLLVNLTARDMRKLRQHDPRRGQKLSSWIGMLATHAAWDHLRALSRRPPSAGLREAADLDHGDASPFDAVVERERWRLVNRTLRSLSEGDRRFVRLFYVEAMSPEQIADRLGISVKTVYTRKHKIRCRLERALRTERQAVVPAAA